MGCTTSQQDEYMYEPSRPPESRTSKLSFSDNYFTARQKQLLRQTWTSLDKDPVDIGINIFLKIFEAKIETKQLFPFGALNGQQLLSNPLFRSHALRFIHAIGSVVKNLDALDLSCGPILIRLGRKHAWITDFVNQYLDVFKESTSKVFQEELGPAKCNEEVLEAWSNVFSFIAVKMNEGYEEALREKEWKKHSVREEQSPHDKEETEQHQRNTTSQGEHLVHGSDMGETYNNLTGNVTEAMSPKTDVNDKGMGDADIVDNKCLRHSHNYNDELVTRADIDLINSGENSQVIKESNIVIDVMDNCSHSLSNQDKIHKHKTDGTKILDGPDEAQHCCDIGAIGLDAESKSQTFPQTTITCCKSEGRSPSSVSLGNGEVRAIVPNHLENNELSPDSQEFFWIKENGQRAQYDESSQCKKEDILDFSSDAVIRNSRHTDIISAKGDNSVLNCERDRVVTSANNQPSESSIDAKHIVAFPNGALVNMDT